MGSFCNWLLEQDLLPDPMISAIHRNHTRPSTKSSVEYSEINTRVVVSVIDLDPIPSNINDKRSRLHHEVCSQAILTQGLLDEYPFKLRFRCGCEAVDHTDYLTFYCKHREVAVNTFHADKIKAMLSATSLPILDLRNDEKATWQMVLFDVNRKPVSVTICVKVNGNQGTRSRTRV